MNEVYYILNKVQILSLFGINIAFSMGIGTGATTLSSGELTWQLPYKYVDVDIDYEVITVL